MTKPAVQPPPGSGARAFDMSLEIAAPIDAVWRALADAEELARWFVTEAKIEPREGGRFALAWDGDWAWTTNIDAWEPPHRLRLVDRSARPFDAEGKPIAAAEPVELVLEFTLEAHGDRTRLTVVHSGFGRGASWDDELDGVSHGWQVELRILRHYLEHHRGTDRRRAWVRATTGADLPRVWAALTAPTGLVTSGLEREPRTGDRCSLLLATGDRIAGPVVHAHPGRQLVVSAENLGHSVFRLSLDRAGGRTMIFLGLSAYALPGAEVQGFEARARAGLDRVLRERGLGTAGA